jgi:hypothetical protein
MRLPMVAIVVALSVVGAGDGQSAEQKPDIVFNNYFTGNDYVGMPEDQQIFYLGGVLDGLQAGLALGAPPPQKLSECLHGKPISQAHAIVAKYLKEHPESWNLQAGALVYNAFNGTCGRLR